MPNAKPDGSTFLVGVGGGTASGKSTFARALVRVLNATAPELAVLALNCDRYFRAGSPAMPTFVSPSTGETLPDFNHPDSIDVARLLADLDAHRRSPDGPDVLIVEGHLLLHWTEVRERLHLRLFLDLDDDTRALRRLIRNLGHEHDPISDHSPQSIATYYLESAKVGHARYIEPSRVHADLILRGDADFERTAPLIADLIRVRAQAEPVDRTRSDS